MSEFDTQQVDFVDRKSGNELSGRFIVPRQLDKRPMPLIIYLTGDGPRGSKSSSWVNLPPLMAARGIASFLFDFEGLGDSPGERSKLTVTRAISNYRSAFEFTLHNPVVSTNQIGVLGSSFGGAVALLAPETTNVIRSLGLKSPSSFLPDAYINECGDEAFQSWLKSGYSESLGYPLSILKDALRRNVFRAASGIHVPTLITHGTADEIVPIRQSHLLRVSLGGLSNLVVFRGAGHGYSEGDSWSRMANTFVDWFANTLNVDGGDES
jgi:dipeptidyl aminopeptidase/acylaminoacyl peptidase